MAMEFLGWININQFLQIYDMVLSVLKSEDVKEFLSSSPYHCLSTERHIDEAKIIFVLDIVR